MSPTETMIILLKYGFNMIEIIHDHLIILIFLLIFIGAGGSVHIRGSALAYAWAGFCSQQYDVVMALDATYILMIKHT